MRTVSLHVTGVVQGVGFRPFVYTLATGLGLTGWVKNTSEGVFCVVEGPPDEVATFIDAVRAEAPPMAVIESVAVKDIATEGFDAFSIISSEAVDDARTLVSPDIATCAACDAEMRDPRNRRYRYPFTNCTNCGPRFTIIEDVPYDRPMTTMRDFPLCPECAAEYADPADRRFHAQPNACFRCGPRLYLNVMGRPAVEVAGAVPQAAVGGTPEASSAAEGPRRGLSGHGTSTAALPSDYEWTPEREAVPRPHRDADVERTRSEAVIAEAVRLLRDGLIVAVKGLGGFQLACDAHNEEAVARLRQRKNRWGKPLAVMVPDLEHARAYCQVSDEEAALLSSRSAPIVLLRLRHGAVDVGVAGTVPRAGEADPAHVGGPTESPRRGPHGQRVPRPLAPSLAPGLRELGVMLPYTPLHNLLLSAFGGVLVMTSGNRSDEPIATGNQEALDRLGDIADAFLMHDRDIYSRYDDSVLRIGEGIEFIRRARGHAPFPLAFPVSSDVAILACGPEQKNTFALVSGEHAFVSQHIGDMENAETLESYERTLALFERLFRIHPGVVAYDLHPEYLSTKYALALGLPAVGVQHHHAHIASVAAEHGIDGQVLGVALDGTGYGTDGHIWGGEWLAADWRGFARVAHLRELPLPGGAAAVRRPARMALGALAACGLLDHPGALPLRERLAQGEEDNVLAMIAHRLNTPLTSSMGRLFDAVAALVGVRDDALYEGQAAIELEALADPAAEGAYGFGADERADGTVVIDSAPVLAALLDDLAAGVGAAAVSARFHRAVVAAIVDGCAGAASALGLRQVALSGGVFMNRLVLAGAVRGLAEAGLEPLTHRRLPANDGGVAFGQAVVAWARRHEI